MKKLNKVAALFASAALAVPVTVFAQAKTGGDNWRNSDGTVWKNGTGENCWRDASWTPATAADICDGALKPAPDGRPGAGAGTAAPAAAACRGPGRAAAAAAAAARARPARRSRSPRTRSSTPASRC